MILKALPRPRRRSLPSQTLRLTEIMLGVNVAMSAAEALAHRHLYGPGELLDWRVARTRHKILSRRSGRVLDCAMGRSGVIAIQAARVACAAAMVAPRMTGQLRAVAMVGAAAGAAALHVRSPYGSDGSEHLAMIVTGAAAGARLLGENEQAERYALRFIAAQAALSYLAAGLSKAYSPSWRAGNAVRDILRTRMYGHERVHQLLSRRRRLGRFINLYTIVWECSFPAIFFLPAVPAAGVLVHSAGFHLGNAYVMGLNRFFPAFLATYPAIAYATPSLRRLIDHEMTARGWCV